MCLHYPSHYETKTTSTDMLQLTFLKQDIYYCIEFLPHIYTS